MSVGASALPKSVDSATSSADVGGLCRHALKK